MVLYLGPDSDSIFVALARDGAWPASMCTMADGVILHMDAEGGVVALEVFDVSKRGGFRIENLDDECWA